MGPVLLKIICLIKIRDGRRTDRQTDRWTNGQADRQTDRQTETGDLFLSTLGVMKGREKVCLRSENHQFFLYQKRKGNLMIFPAQHPFAIYSMSTIDRNVQYTCKAQFGNVGI